MSFRSSGWQYQLSAIHYNVRHITTFWFTIASCLTLYPRDISIATLILRTKGFLHDCLITLLAMDSARIIKCKSRHFFQTKQANRNKKVVELNIN